jgi:hypothetical protein
MASLKKRIEGEIESALAGLGGGPVKTAEVCEAILNGWGVDKESFGATASGQLLWTREYPKAFATLRKKGLIYAPQWGQVALGAGSVGEPTPKAKKAVKEAPVVVEEVEAPLPTEEVGECPSPVDDGESFTEEGAPSSIEDGEDNFTEEGALLDPPAPVEDDGDNFTEADEERLAELTDISSHEETPSDTPLGGETPLEEETSSHEDNFTEEDISDLFDEGEEEEPQAERVPLPERQVSFKGKDYLFYAMSEDGYITVSDDALEGAVTVKLSQGDIEDELEGVQAKLYQAVQKDEDNFLKALAHRSTAMGFDSPMGCFGSGEEREECAKCFMDIWCKSHETFRAS